MARQVNGHLGTFSSLTELTNKFPPSESIGCSANVGTAIPFTKAWCNGSEWAEVNAPALQALVSQAGIRRGIVILGDSISKQGTSVTAVTTRYNNYGWWVFAMALLGWPGRIVAVGAVNGYTTSDINDLWDTLELPDVVDEVWGLIGQNDIAAGNVPAALAELDLLIAKAKARGAVVRLGTVTARDASQITATSKSGMAQYNAGLRARARAGKIKVFDSNSYTTDLTSTDGAARSGLIYDGSLHLGIQGSYQAGKAFANAFSADFVDGQEPLQAGVSYPDSRTLTADSNILVVNPRCVGTGSAAGTGCTGTTATGWSLQRVSGSTLAAAGSQVVDADAAARRWQRMTFSGSPAGTERIRIFQNTLVSALLGNSVIGQTAIGRATIRSSSLPATFKLVRLIVECLDGGSATLYTAESMSDSALTAAFWPTETLTLETPEFVFPAGTVTIRTYIEVQFVAGAASGTLDVCDMWPELV